ncbi:MAG: AMP-binding protein [Rhodospirillales bacterium]
MDTYSSGYGTIVDAISRHARERPDETAITFLTDGAAVETSLTFADVEKRSRAIASEILKKVPEAERVMVLQAPGLDFVLSLCACFVAGVAAVPTPVPVARASSNASQRFARLFADAAPDAIVTHSELLARSRWLVEGQIGLATQNWILSDTCGNAHGQPALPEVLRDDLALLQYTSGSTAEPKGVLIDHANLAANLAAIQAKFELNAKSIVVSWLPPYHDMGLIGGVISALWCGYHVVLMDPAHFIKRPLNWLEAIDRHKADVSGGANFAYDLCVDALARADKPAFDLSRWRLAFSGAEPVRASTIKRFSDAFADHGFHREAFYPCYGLAEATLMVTGPDTGALRPRIIGTDDARQFVSCGTPCAGISIEITDPETGATLADGTEGEIRITGSSVSRGYWRRDGGTGSGSLATGDFGFMQAGELFVTGRLKDLIIIRGRNVAPSDIEDAVAMCHPALAPAAAAAFPVETGDGESFVLAAEIRREHRRNADWPRVFTTMRGRIAEQTGLTPTDIVLLRPGTLARTTSGKIRRQACRDAYLGGEWDPLARSAEQAEVAVQDETVASRRMATASQGERWASISDYLVWRLAQLTSTPEAFLTPDTALDTVGLDSLKQVELALLVERDLEVTLPFDWFDRAPTVSALASELQALRGHSQRLEYESDGPAASETGASVPMTPRQLDFFESAPTHPEQFAEILYFRTPKGASADNLKRAIKETVGVHDAFSLRFQRGDTGWRARIENGRPSSAFRRIDVSMLGKSAYAETRSEVLKGILDGFSLNDGIHVSAVLLDRGVVQHGLLAVGFHHLVIDAVSLSAWAVRFQHAFDDIVNERQPHTSVSVNGYLPWLRALEDYGQSSELADELDYWRRTCGIADEPSSAVMTMEDAAWRSTGKTTLPAADNQRLLELFQTPLARNGLVLAALCRAWTEVKGGAAPLIMTESHGRYPFPGTDPSRAVGWFAVRHPVTVPFVVDANATDMVRDAAAQLCSVPKLGHGYGLLRQRPKGDPLRVEMERLRRPVVLLQYRGNVDDTFRAEATLPVIAVHHEARAHSESCRNLGDVLPMAVMAGLSDGVLYWSVFFDNPDLDDKAQKISDGMRGFFAELVSH